MEPILSSPARLLSSRASQPVFCVAASKMSSATLFRLSNSAKASASAQRSFAIPSTSPLRSWARPMGIAPPLQLSPASSTRRWASKQAAPPSTPNTSTKSGKKGRQEGSSSSFSAPESASELVIYRGPAASRPWLNFAGGLFFIVSGLSIASVVQDHLAWPLYRSEDNPPELLAPWKRKLAAGGIFFLGSAFAWLFWIVPSKTITRLTLRPAERELIIRTASPGLVNLFPRMLLRGPFRRVAQGAGFHLLPRRDERLVPLDAVYRIYGSAVGAEWGSSQAKRSTSASSAAAAAAAQPQKKRSLQMIVGRERLFYSVEAAGGADPSQDASIAKRGLYARGFYNFVHSIRGKTDWRDAVKPGQAEEDVRKEALAAGPTSAGRQVQYRKLGDKEPWFMDRRNFDELLPLILKR